MIQANLGPSLVITQHGLLKAKSWGKDGLIDETEPFIIAACWKLKIQKMSLSISGSIEIKLVKPTTVAYCSVGIVFVF